MCGGRGTRLALDTEKPLVDVRGTPMIERVLAALAGSRVETTYAVCSPHAPATRAHIARSVEDAETIAPGVLLDAPGEGYVADLQYALERADPPVLTVTTDLPLLAPDVVDRILTDAPAERSLAVYVPAALKRQLGVSVDASWERAGRALVPAGVHVVGRIDDRTDRTDRPPADDGETAMSGADDTDGMDATTDERIRVSYDARLAVNVNRREDLAVAEALCE